MFFALSLFPAISATDTIDGVGAWSLPWITEFLPVIYIAVGIALVGAAVGWALGLFGHRKHT
jgi:hypothetical protein